MLQSLAASLSGYNALNNPANFNLRSTTRTTCTSTTTWMIVFSVVVIVLISFSATYPASSIRSQLVDPSNPNLADDTISPSEEQAIQNDLDQHFCTSRRKQRCGLGTSSPRVIYVHIPKAGGTSIQTAMRGWVEKSNGAATYLMANGPSYFKSSFACPPGSLSHSVLAGHRGFGYCKDVETNGRGMFTFTAFREPVARAVSLHDYNLITIGDSKDTWENAFAARESLSDAIKRFNRTEEIERGEALLRFAGSQQTRFMCGYECLGPNVHGNETYSNAYMLERAKINLLKLDVVGVSERLDDLIPQLKMHLALVPRGFTRWPESNAQTPKKKSVLDDDAKAILLQWSQTDTMLYRLADAIAQKKTAEAERCVKL